MMDLELEETQVSNFNTGTRDESQADPLFSAEDPVELFRDWLAEAQESEPLNPDSMSLATVDDLGHPNVRMVLLKGADHTGFVFYTNTESQKAHELRACPRAALCFYWKSLRRQVRLQGSVSPVSDEEADAYFATRSKDAQIGAWASKQSRAMAGRFELEVEVAKYTAKYALKSVERPPFWSGYRLQPTVIEFWRERHFRLHDRRIFSRTDTEQLKWTVQRLYP
jgi:pyridoxamine 5'-phosphate oxidase